MLITICFDSLNISLNKVEMINSFNFWFIQKIAHMLIWYKLVCVSKGEISGGERGCVAPRNLEMVVVLSKFKLNKGHFAYESAP